MSLFVAINPGEKREENIADSIGVHDAITNPNEDIDRNGLYPYKFGDEFGTIIQISNKNDPNPGTDGHWIRQLKFRNDGSILSRFRINNEPWSEWEAIPFASSTIKSITFTDNSITVTKGDGSTETKTITSVKGNAESTYRTGEVNITPENVGAVPITGGNVTGVLTVTGNTQYDSAQLRNVSMSTSEPSGGINGQVHFKYT